MPLKKQDVCSHCKRPAWHEMACFGDLEAVCWICCACGNRRAKPRLRLNDTRQLYQLTIRTPSGNLDAALCNISNHGAKLRRIDPAAPCPAQGTAVVLVLDDCQLPSPESAIRAVVRWAEGDLLGLAFDPPLDHALEALAQALGDAPERGTHP